MVTSSESGVRCGTCRWWTNEQGADSWGPCRKGPYQPYHSGKDGCGEWAHDPRRFEALGHDGEELDATQGEEEKFFAMSIRDLETGEVLAVRWPWEGEG